jgi:AcrR family transcriptional regulator
MPDLTARQQEIIDVAMRLIADGGIQQLTMHNIARQIGISEPAIYRHFTSKQHILLTMLGQFARRAEFQSKQAQFFESSGIILLETLFLEYIGLCANHPSIAAVMFSEDAFRSDPQVHAEIFRVMTVVYETVSRVVERAQSKGEIRPDVPKAHLAFAILGSLRLLVKHWSMSHYAFDLQHEGQAMWESLKVLLKPAS